jgi:hypothetical protein
MAEAGIARGGDCRRHRRRKANRQVQLLRVGRQLAEGPLRITGYQRLGRTDCWGLPNSGELGDCRFRLEVAARRVERPVTRGAPTGCLPGLVRSLVTAHARGSSSPPLRCRGREPATPTASDTSGGRGRIWPGPAASRILPSRQELLAWPDPGQPVSRVNRLTPALPLEILSVGWC